MTASTPNKWSILVFGLVMQSLTIGIGTYGFSFFVVPWMTEFSVQRGELMLGMTGAAIALVFIGPVAGILIDRYQNWVLVSGASLIFAAGLVGVSMAPAPWVIVLMFSLLIPVGSLLAGPLMAQTLVARAFVERKGMALGITALGTSIGGFVMPLLETSLLAHYHWRTVILVLAALVVALVTLVSPLVLRANTPSLAAAPAPAKSGHGGTDWRLMRSPGVLMLGASYVIPLMTFVAVLHNLGAYARDLDLSQRQAAWILSTASIVMVVSKLMVGTLADRVEQRRIYYVLLAITAAGTVLTGGATGLLSLGFGVALLGITAGGVGPLMSTIVAKRYGTDKFGSVIGVLHAIAALSGFLPAAVGWIRDFSGSYSIAFALLLLPIIPALYCFIRHSRLPSPQAAT